MEPSFAESLFAPAKRACYDNARMDYSKLEYVSQLLDSISTILPHNAYIIDYYRQNFLFLSSSSIFLCGYTVEEVMGWGFGFLEKVLLPHDRERLLEINQAGLDLFYSITLEERQSGFISYDLLMQRKNGSSFCANLRLKPYLFDADGNMWLLVSCARLSANSKTGQLYSYIQRTKKRFGYSFKEKRWLPLSPLELTANEQSVARETDRGTSEKQLVDMLGCSRSTIRYYKSQILKKTEATTMREAILCLSTFGIL